MVLEPSSAKPQWPGVCHASLDLYEVEIKSKDDLKILDLFEFEDGNE